MRKNIIANFFGRFWGILSNFLFIPLYIKYLGFDAYSVISFALVLAGIIAIIDAGLTATLSREFSRTDMLLFEKQRVFKTLETIFLVFIGATLGLFFLSINFIVTHWISLNNFRTDELSFLLKIISFDICLQLLFRFYLGGLLGMELQVKANLYQILWGIVRNGVVVLVIMYYPKIEMFFLWQAMSTFFFTLLLKLMLHKTLYRGFIADLKPAIEIDVVRRVSRFAGGMFIIAIVSAVNTQMDKIAITKFLSIKVLGYYTLAVTLSQALLVIISPIGTALLPRFTALYSEGNKIEASLLFKKVNTLVSILVFSFMANMIYFAKELIWIWTNNIELSNQAYVFLPISSISMAMLAIVTIPYYIAIANGYTSLNTIIGIVSIIIILPAYFLGAKIYGAVGVASIFAIVQTLTTFVYFYFINRKFISSKIIEEVYIKQILLPLLLAIAIVYPFSFIPIFVENTRFLLLTWIGISTIITIIISTFVLIPIKELKSFK